MLLKLSFRADVFQIHDQKTSVEFVRSISDRPHLMVVGTSELIYKAKIDTLLDQAKLIVFADKLIELLGKESRLPFLLPQIKPPILLAC